MAALLPIPDACGKCGGDGCPDGACLPPGGAPGYVLTKDSGVDYDASWQPGGGGGGGGSSTISTTASQNITAYKVVGLDSSGLAYLVDNTVLADQYRIAGLAMFSANTGDPLDIITDGLLVTGGGLWTPGPYYLGVAGILVSTPPVTGLYLRVATAPTANELIVRPQEPIVRA